MGSFQTYVAKSEPLTLIRRRDSRRTKVTGESAKPLAAKLSRSIVAAAILVGLSFIHISSFPISMRLSLARYPA